MPHQPTMATGQYIGDGSTGLVIVAFTAALSKVRYLQMLSTEGGFTVKFAIDAGDVFRLGDNSVQHGITFSGPAFIVDYHAENNLVNTAGVAYTWVALA